MFSKLNYFMLFQTKANVVVVDFQQLLCRHGQVKTHTIVYCIYLKKSNLS